MSDNKTTIWETESAQQLAEALVSIDNAAAMQNFLRDVMTEKEITEISARLETARMLKDGKKYTEIVEETKLSSRTVARISDWIKNGCGGYNSVISQLNSHHNHISPARAE